jgi:hypothetical protein
MMTAMLTAKNILAGEQIFDVWQVNQDAEYHEEAAADSKTATQRAAFGERLVPTKIIASA